MLHAPLMSLLSSRNAAPLTLMSHFHDLQTRLSDCISYNLFLLSKYSRSDIICTVLHMIHDFRCQHHKNLLQDIRNYNIITLISRFVLYIFIINDITYDKFKTFILYIICRLVLTDRIYRTWIKISADRTSGSIHHRNYRKNSATCSTIQNSVPLLLKLAHPPAG